MKFEEIRNKIQAAKNAAECERFFLDMAERMTEDESKRYTVAGETVRQANRAMKALDGIEEYAIKRLDYEIKNAESQYCGAKVIVEMLQEQLHGELTEGEFHALCAAKRAAEETATGYLNKWYNLKALAAFVNE